MHATGRRAAGLEELQFTLGEGPCTDAFTSGSPVLQVYQATGMVSAQRGVGLEESLALLRAHAFAQDLTLGEVAAAMVTRRLRLDSGEPAG